MANVTVTKTKYEILEKRASLYEKILRSLKERKWGIEEYSQKRLKEFISQDKINKNIQSRLKKLLSLP
jgi:hypothetical protein